MKFIIKRIFVVLILCISGAVSADDTEILDYPASANILFVMDLSGSMGWGKEPNSVPDPTTDPSRLSALREAFQKILVNEEFENMNFGLSVFSGGTQNDRGASVAHGINYPVSPLLGAAQDALNSDTYTHPGTDPNSSFMPDAGAQSTREYLSLLSSTSVGSAEWEVGGSTPIVDALYEAARYFRGEEVDKGKFIPSDVRSAHPSTYVGNFSIEENTITPACTTDSRKRCAKGTCGPTEDNCAAETITYQSDDAGEGCTINDVSRQRCNAVNENASPQECGSNNNCVLLNETWTRQCWNSHKTIQDCLNVYPDYHSCEVKEGTTPGTNSEGQPTEEPYTKVECKENVTLYQCDSDTSYTCSSTVDFCDKCPEDTITTEIVGSATYKSPIVGSCSNNGIIFLTDGEPTANNSESDIQTTLGISSCVNNDSDSDGSDDFKGKGKCAIELAEFLATEDQATGSTSLENIPGKQIIKTHTIGLSIDKGSKVASYLSAIATSGGGTSVIADNKAGTLEAAFKSIVSSIAGKSRSFAAPSYSVDTSTLLSHGNSVYVPMFDKKGAVWPGNLKKFQLINGELKDIDGNPATDDNGAILSTAQDMWSNPAIAATDSVTSGGAANKINPAERLSGKMMTNMGGTLVSLSNAANDAFAEGATTAEKTAYLDYISGKNSDDTARNHMGDIMHSKPVQLEIAKSAGNEKTIFVGSNEGFLHAINDADGTEAFAFMPYELIKNIKPQYQNEIQSTHMYGVDSPLTLWIDESANTGSNSKITRGNGVLDVADNEKAYLFFGLRRGGKGYYALDVTVPTTPRLVWTAEFGDGNSWSQPVVKMLKPNKDDDIKPVLVFGGGFSDDINGSETLGQANSVYIVDALDGDEIWSKTTTTTQLEAYSVPAKIRTLDVDRNGSIDRLYFGDTGGNIWRVDLDAGKTNITTPAPYDLTKAELHKLASLGGSGTVKRKFFEEPAVALFKDKGKAVITIAIGSGDRTGPLSNDVSDKFFVIYDKDVYGPPEDNTAAILLSNLSSWTSTTTFNTSAASFKGWYKSLTSTTGEKVLSTATIYQNKILFTTFGTTTPDPDSNTCVDPNESRFYVLDLKTGEEYLNDKASNGEILGTPQLIFPSITEDNCTSGNCKRAPVKACAGYCGSGRSLVDMDALGGASAITNSLNRVYWMDR